MAKAKHTPGPWEVTGVSMNDGSISIGQQEQRIVIAYATNAASFGDMLVGAVRRGGGALEPDDCHTQWANARLIAAAPDLLAALINLLPDAEAAAKEFGYEPTPLIAARAALAKAGA